MTEASIVIKNLRIGQPRKKAEALPLIKGVDLSIPKGKIVGIVGESGSGKSLTMKSVLGIVPKGLTVEADEMTLDGKALSSYEKLPISMIFQDPMTSLNPLRKIGYHLREIVERFHADLSKEEQEALILDMIKKVGIPQPQERLNQYPFEFSGGMRQRIMIAMALLADPEVLIADEPTTALDVTIQAQILALINELQESFGLTVVIVSHDFGVIAGLCDYVKVMRNGQFVEEGTVEEIFSSPQHPYTQALLSAARLEGSAVSQVALDDPKQSQMVAISETHRVRRRIAE